MRYLLVLVCTVLLISGNIMAQDTLDVEPGFETLNLAIEGDTTETGEVKNPNRVWRLQRGGFYLLNGSVENTIGGAQLTIVAAEGDGPLPIIVPAVDETGSASRAFRLYGDGTFKNLYISGIDNLGNQATKNMFRNETVGGRLIIDGCFLDHDAQAFIRMNTDDQKLYITNSTMRNSILLSNPGNGRFVDTRGNIQDTIMVQNSTLYMCSVSAINTWGNPNMNVILDHVTFYQFGHPPDVMTSINGQVTNCLFIDGEFEGDLYPTDPLAALADSLADELLPIDSLTTSELGTDADRVMMYKNNVYGWSPEIKEIINAVDTVGMAVLHNARTQRFLDTYPQMTSENNIEEYPDFVDAPDPSVLATYVQYRLESGGSNENNPDPRADRNGMAALDVDPASFGPAEDEYDFAYSTDNAAYTHAEGGFPAGDLNWFPDKKAEWEEWIATGVEERKSLPTHFVLKQNYPNPFNPQTTIEYVLRQPSTVELTVYNAIGQKIRTLVSNEQQAMGTHKVVWDGKDNAGVQAPSGIYFYQLKAGDEIQRAKMILMK